MEAQNNNVSQETNPQPQANVAPKSLGNAFETQTVAPAQQLWAQQAQAVAPNAQVVAQAPAPQQQAQSWNQQVPVTQQPAPTLQQMWDAINTSIDSSNLRNSITIRNKYSNGDLVKSNAQQPQQATLVGFGLCMNKGVKQSMGLTTRIYNRLVCDLADKIANTLGGWHCVDVNPTNASAIDCFDKNQVQRPPRQQQQYAQPQYAPQYAQPQQYAYAPPQQYAQPQYAPQYGYAQAPQQSYSYPPQQQYTPAPHQPQVF